MSELNNNSSFPYLFNRFSGCYIYNNENNTVEPAKSFHATYGSSYQKVIDSDLTQFEIDFRSSDDSPIIVFKDLGVVVRLDDYYITILHVIGHLYRGNSNLSHELPKMHFKFNGLLTDAVSAHHLVSDLINNYDGSLNHYCPSFELKQNDDMIKIIFEDRIYF